MMSYIADYPAAARRHLDAADHLADGTCRRVAGYLYGIAAECALKAIMREERMSPKGARGDDPFYAHFPQLLTLLRDSTDGRLGGRLAKVIQDYAFMNQWDTAMRYCKGGDIQEQWILRWQAQARHIVGAIGT